MISIISFYRIDTIPKNISTIAKELFRTVVCLKPRLIRSGIERIHSLSNTDELDSEENDLNTGNIHPSNATVEASH